MGMLDIMKKAGVGAFEASNPVIVLYGTVTKINPLEVNVNQRLTLPNDLLVVPQHVGTLQKGDKVLLLRVQGGQQLIVFGKVVEA